MIAINLLSLKIYEITGGINASYYPEGSYLRVVQLTDMIFPITSIEGKSNIEFISSNGVNNIENYIEYGSKNGLTHLVVDQRFIDDGNRKDNFLDDVFLNEKKYSYLIKEFDSIDEGYSYHLKIFKIDYDKFKKIK